MDDKKVEKVKNWQPPSNVTEVQKFLGFTGYYRYFIQDYSRIARPLLDLTIKTTLWHWENDQQKVFEQLRDQMCNKPVLRQPDFIKKFFVHSDASAYGVGAILSLRENLTHQTPQNPAYTQSLTTRQHLHPQKETTTSTNENS